MSPEFWLANMRAGAEGISIIFTLPIRLVVFWYSFRVARQVSIEIYFHCSIKPSNTCMQNKSLRGKNFQLPYDWFLSCSNGTEHHRASPNVTNKKKQNQRPSANLCQICSETWKLSICTPLPVLQNILPPRTWSSTKQFPCAQRCKTESCLSTLNSTNICN